MSTEAQIEANRQNALKSTGPRTDEGKEQSRMNATTHGCTSRLIAEKVQLSETFIATHARLRNDVQPKTPHQEGYIEVAVSALLLGRMCVHSLDSELAKQKNIAAENWSYTQRTAALQLLGTIRKNPRFVAAELQQSLAGCQLLIEEWKDLKDVSANMGEWNDDRVAQAFDLLGIPKNLRSQSMKIRPNNCDNIRLHQGDLADSEIDRLEIAIEMCVNRADEAERLYRIMASDCLITPKAESLVRYLHAANGRFDRYLSLSYGKTSAPTASAQPKTTASNPPFSPIPAQSMPPVRPPSPQQAPASPPEPEHKYDPDSSRNPFRVLEMMLVDAVDHVKEHGLNKEERKAYFKVIIDKLEPICSAYIQYCGLTDQQIQTEKENAFSPLNEYDDELAEDEDTGEEA